MRTGLAAAQKATDEKLDKLLQQTQAAADAAAKANASVAGLEPILKEQVAEQQKSYGANAGLKVDQMADGIPDAEGVGGDAKRASGELKQLIADIKTALTTMQAPPAPPGEAPAGQGGLSPETLFQNALAGQERGQHRPCAQGVHGLSRRTSARRELAPQAQYYIGEIYYNRSELEKAVDAFDVVLEKYQENDKTPDAHYMKGMALLKLGKRAEARREFDELIKRFPGNPLASQAKKQIAALAPAAKQPASKSKGK